MLLIFSTIGRYVLILPTVWAEAKGAKPLTIPRIFSSCWGFEKIFDIKFVANPVILFKFLFPNMYFAPNIINNHVIEIIPPSYISILIASTHKI